MKLMIDIPEEEYKKIKACTAPMTWTEHLIKNGTPLSEGDLISRADAIDACNQSINLLEAVDRIKEL